MDRRAERYWSEKFENWRRRARAHLPEVTRRFYAHPEKGYADEMQLGRVIRDLSDPMYSITYDGKRLDDINRTAMRVILEIEVEEVFRKIYTSKSPLR